MLVRIDNQQKKFTLILGKLIDIVYLDDLSDPFF